MLYTLLYYVARCGAVYNTLTYFSDSIPYVALYDDPKSARRRSCFIPAYDVLAEITNAERNKRRFSGYLHPFM